MKKSISRIISVVMALLMCFELSFSSLTVSAAEEVLVEEIGIENVMSTESDALWDGVSLENQIQTEKGQVNYFITGLWEGGFSAKITILNNTELPINKWALSFVSPNVLNNIWNATVIEDSENVHIQGLEWNQTIAVGESIEIGFTGEGSFLGFPISYDLYDLGCVGESNELEAEMTYVSDTYTINQKVYDIWDGGYNASLEIKNTGENEIRNWYLQFENDCSWDSVSNAQVFNYENGIITLKCYEWNANIQPGESVVVNYCCNDTFAGFASEYALVGDYSMIKDGEFEVNYILDDVWEDGFSGFITIHNLTEETFEDWSLEFDYGNEFISVWNGKVDSYDNGHYVISNADYNNVIEPDEVISIGFLVNNGDVEETLSNINMYRYVIYDEEVKSDDVLEDENNYIKESTVEDIVYDNDGLPYIKNQIVFMTYLGTDKRIIDKLVSEIGADFVGYIQSICFYQIEFGTNKSYEEMVDYVKFLEAHSYIMYADVNYVTEEIEADYFSNDTLYNDGTTCKNVYIDKNGNGIKDYGETSLGQDSSKKDTNDVTKPEGDNWGLEALNVPGAWDYLSFLPSGEKVKVGILDNMFGNNPDIDNQLLKKYNNPTTIDSDHGTHVAGIIGAEFDNNYGMSGVATSVEMYGYSIMTKVDTTAEKALCFTTIIDTEKAKVVNISYGYGYDMVFSASHGDAVALKHIEKDNKAVKSILQNLIFLGNDFLIMQAAGNVNNIKFVKNPSSSGFSYVEYDKNKPEHQGLDIYQGGTDAQYSFWTTYISDEVIKNHILVVGAVKNELKNGKMTFPVTEFSNLGLRVDVYAPGYDILSTVSTNKKYGGFQLLNGTSMATPYITGLAALIWQANPELSSAQVRKIIIDSQGYPVLDSSGNQLTASGKTYYIPDAEECIKEALKTYGQEWVHPELPSGTVQGKITDVYGNPLENIDVMFVRTSAGQSNLDDYWFVEKTDANGEYEKLMPQGTYEIIVSTSTCQYVPYCIKKIVVQPDETRILDTIILQEVSLLLIAKDGTVQGSVYNALDGKAIAGASIIPRSGWNSEEGVNLLEVYCYGEKVITDANGNFDITLPIGQYTLEISKDGYVIGYYNVVSRSDDGVQRMYYVLTPIMKDGEYRIILTWNSTPRDLDSHLTYYESGATTSSMHVYYSNKRGKVNGIEVAELDLDDTNGYGPETVTLTVNATILDNNAYFRYSVHDYTNRGSGSTSKALSYSGAVVRVYGNNELLETYNVPTNRIGNVWQVFKLSEAGLQTLGTFKNKSSSDVE